MISEDQRSSDSVIAHLSHKLVGWFHVIKGGILLINNDQGFFSDLLRQPNLLHQPRSRLHNNTDHMTLRNKRGREFFLFIFKLKPLGLVSIEILPAIWVTFVRFFN